MPATTGNDSLVGTSASETLDGLAGNDTLVGGAGNDTLLGGSGVDTAVFNAAFSNYTLLRNPNGSLAVSTSLVSGDGTDQLLSVENLKFSDALVTPLMAGAPAEIKVNNLTAAGGGARVAKLPDGGWVSIWSSGTSTAVATLYGQRYNAAGSPVGAEFLANPNKVGSYDYGHNHAISALADGGWVVTWAGIDNSGYGIFGQRFSSSGVASPNGFAVSTYAGYNQLASSVTGLSDGGWLCVWNSRNQDGSDDGIVMRRFGGYPETEFIVNTYRTNFQQLPSVAALSSGGWVIVWQSNGQDSSGMGVYGQAYNANGTALGSEFLSNTTTSNAQSNPAVAGLADGGWIVAWQSYQDGGANGIYSQRYAAAGTKVGSEFRVNTETVGDQRSPTVTALKDGGWVVVWESDGQDASGLGVYGQRYGADGVAVGSEFKINYTTDNAQTRPSVSALEDGGWVVSWHSASSVMGKYGIFYQRYGADGTAFASSYSLNVIGDANSQNFVGTVWADTLSGMGGNDTLNGGVGADSMSGGLGNDTFFVDDVGDKVVELANEGTDTVIASINSVLPANVENFEFSSGSTATTVTGNELNNSIGANAANNTIDGGTGADTMAGGAGDDVYSVDNTGDRIIEQAGAGTDRVISSVSYTLAANVEAINLTGTANLSATGNELNNTLTGNSGIDTLTGGAGNDTYVISHQLTVVVEGASAGIDTVISNSDYALSSNVENLVLSGTSAVIGVGNTLANDIVGNAASNVLNGDAGTDTLTGGDGNDIYLVDVTSDVVIERDNEGIDEVRSSVSYSLLRAVPSAVEVLTLTGQSSLVGSGNELNNTLTGNGGIDTLLGATGDDVYIVNNTADLVLENANSGTDEVRSSVSYTITDNVERLVLTGANGIVGYGNSGDNTIVSNSGINTLVGGAGNDTYYVDQSADLVIELAGGGAADEISSTANYVLPDQVEKLTLTGWTALNATGNALNNTITGNTLANSLVGGAGNDSIDGSLGADTMVGGTGDDVYYIDDVNDKVIENAGEGTDFVSSYVSYVLNDTVENLQLSGSNATNGAGNALANQITGNDGANSLTGGDGHDTLNGGAGADTLVGGIGDDVYFVADASDIVIESASAGTDTVFSSVSYRLSSTIENLTINSGAAVDGVGNALNNVITGSYGANMLAGAAGDDTLIGSSGADTLAGGLGYDTAVFSGKISDYVISQNTTTGGIAYTVADQRQGMDATDLVIGVERLKFSDGVIQLVQTTSAATVPDVGVNTYKTSTQSDPAVAGFDDGSFVVTWASFGSDGSVWGIAGQRYNAAGLPQGSEFIVNTTTFDGQLYPSVTSLPDQGFVVTWQSNQFDSSGYGIAGQRFDASGQKISSEFLVNNIYKVNAQSAPAVVGLADGGFAVVWQSSGVDGSGLGVCGRLYAATGLPGTDEFKINTTTTGDQDVPSVAALTNGGFVATWRQTTVTSGTATSITLNAQRYDNFGNKNGTEFRVGTRTGVSSTDVAGLSDGGFVVTYVSGSSVYAQRYSSTGAAVSETKVNVSTNSCTDSHVVSNPAGGYVVTWTSAAEDGSGSGVYGRSYADDGSSQGPFRVNDNVTLDQRDSGLAIAGDSLIVAWNSSTIHDGDSTGIALRRFDLNGKQLWSRFDIAGDSSAQLLTGSEYGESIVGLEGADTLYGLAGNDSLDGGAGADSMIGGAGNDAYWVDNPNDRIVEDVSAGIDTVFAGADFAIQGNVENLILTGSGNLSAWGNSLANSLTGNAGNNTLIGGGDNDTYSGGAGDDVYSVSDSGDRVIEIAGEGVDTVISSIDYSLPSEVENLTFAGANSNRGTGNSLANFIVGGGANDTLNGGLGIDSYAGGAGDDVYYIDSSNEVVVESALGGTDTVYSSVNYTLSDNIENLKLNGFSGATGVGNASANYISGEASKNFLSGEGGNDTLDGVNGGDTLAGGLGDDTYIINNSTDFIVEKDGEGFDTVRSNLSYSIENTYADNLLLISGSLAIGNTLSNYIEGNSGNNVLKGLAGADTMAGMQGNDIYDVDDVSDVIVEASSAGTDEVISTVSFKLDANVESLTLIGVGSLSGTGNDLANTIQGGQGDNLLDGAGGDDLLLVFGGHDTLLGGAGNDYLNGDDGNDLLDGGSGNDTLLGNLGRDTMSGGMGNDIYYVNEASDFVVEGSGAGTDTIYSSISFSLGSHQENLYLLGSDALTATGNSFANTIYGNSADNLIDGLSGADTLQGGDGNDTLVGGSGTGDDLLIGGSGVDVALFTGNFSNYQISYAATGGILFSGTDGRDTLSAIEVLQFGDATLKLGFATQTTEVSTDAGSLALNFKDTTLAGQQIGRSNQSAQIADGGTVRVYESLTDVYLERLNPDGTQFTAPSMVNTATAKSQLDPSVTALSDGGWYVVWWSNSVPGNMGIWGQRYSANGSRIGYPSAVDTYGQIYANTTTRPVISSLADGGWVVAYETWFKDGSNYGVAAQRFNSDGVRVGSEFQVNQQSTLGAQQTPSVYGLVDGGWVITWKDLPPDSSTSTLMFKRFDASGNAVQVGGSGYTFDFKGDDTNQVFFGSLNADTLDGGAGIDTLSGGRGDDFYIVDHVADKVVELADEGRDSISSSVSFSLPSNVESLTLAGTASISGIGNASINLITGNSGNNTLDGGEGRDTLAGGTGDDIYVLGPITSGEYVDVVVEGVNAGVDTVRAGASYALPVNVENLILTGTGNFNATGNQLANRIEGNDGSNSLSGGAGLDTLIGGKGDDIYDIGSDADAIIENANEGSDTVIVTSSYALLDNFENLTLTGSAAAQLTGNAVNNEIRGNNAANTLNGGAGNDISYGGGGDDLYIFDSDFDFAVEFLGQGIDTVRSLANSQLAENFENLFLDGDAATTATGNALANRIEGNAGNNTLDGAQGADTLIGGAGNDIYVVDSAQDVIKEDANSGTDEIRSAVDYVLGDNLENLTLTGATAQLGTGNALANRIEGNSSDNTLDGGDGIDTLIGGAGNDVYELGTDADIVIESENQGWDTVRTSVSYTLSSDFERLELLGNDAIDGMGNRLANVLVGNAGSNLLIGLLGDDTLIGLGGENTLIGGEGNDRYLVDSATDSVVEATDQGQDRIISSVSFALSANVEEIELTGSAETSASGNSLRNRIIGSEGNNTLDGGSGADTMVGGRGNDIYVVGESGDVVSEDANEGIDGVRSSIDYRLGAHIESLTLLGTDPLNGTGNELDNRIVGNFGSNILDGGAGADTLEGANGNDVFIVDNAGDVVIELADAGVDEIRSGVSITLADNVDNLSLTGSAALRGTGNQLNNRLAGNEAANTLDGGAGADMMSGGGGDDLYLVDNAGDFVVEAANSGRDEVRSSVDFQLADNLENLQLLGSAALGRGNVLDNVIHGNDANNSLDGGAGSDSMTGGAGDDVYIVDAAGDKVIESAGQGFDEVRSSISYELVVQVEKLTLTGRDNLLAKGNALNNVLIGNAGNNTIVGDTGADTMEGMLGDDIYVVDNLGDVIIEARSGGVDQILSTVSFDLSDNIERLSLLGDQRIVGSGNSLDNVLIGNSAINVLNGLLGNDTLDGGGGADTLIGGSGNDVYSIDSLSDLVIEDSNSGRDRILSSVAIDLPDHIEELVLGPLAGVASVLGNSENNLIVGNVSSNTLSGADGNDTLSGNGGKDVLLGGFGDDVLIATGGNNVFTGGYGGDRFEFSGIINTENTITDLEEGEILQLSDLTEIVSFSAGSSAGLKNGQIRYKIIGQDTDLFVGIGNSGASAVIHLKNFATPNLITTSGNKLGVNINSTPTGAPAVSGSMVEGSLLSASIGTLADADGIKTVLSWQWQRSILADEWQSIDGANGAFYRLSQADVGYRVRALASYTDGKNATESMGSAEGAFVANLNNAPSIFDVAVIGSNVLDAMLKVSAAAIDEDGCPEEFEYRWQRGLDLNRDGIWTENEWVDISGARDVNYKVGLFDTGRPIRVVVSYVDLMGTRESKASPMFRIDSVAELNLSGDDEANDITGSDGKDLFHGMGGNDRLYGFAGDDQLYGDDGDDEIEGDQGNDTLYGGIGNDLMTGGTGKDWLFGGDGIDTLKGSDGADTMDGGQGDDTYFVDDPSDVITDSGTDSDIDVVYLMFTTASMGSYQLGKGIDNASISDSSTWSSLEGNAGNNQLSGNSDQNSLVGGDGNDSLVGNAGNDTLYGGSGNDYVGAGVGDDLIIGGDGAGNDTYVGGEGADTIKYTSAREGIFVDLSVASNQARSLGRDAGIGTDQLSGIENVIGGDFGDYLKGNAEVNSFTGGLGDDTIDGGAGADRAVYAGSSTSYRISSKEGLTFVQSISTPNDRDTLSGIETIQFSDKALSLSPNRAPTGALTIGGKLVQKVTLVAGTTAIKDLDGLKPFSYQWMRDGTAVANATGTTYSLTQSDVGATIGLSVSYTDGRGYFETVSATGATKVSNINDVSTGKVEILGDVKEGAQLSVNHTITDHDGTSKAQFQYQWLANGKVITNATGSTLQLDQGLVGAAISVKVSFVDDLGASESLVSAATGKVANVNNTPTGLPIISGTAAILSTLSVNTAAIADIDGLGTFAYQWQRLNAGSWQDIANATKITYTLTQADSSSQFRVKITYKDKQGALEVVFSDSAQMGTMPLTSAGTAGADTVNGMSGADTLAGGAGNDRISGNGGADKLDGGLGNDQLFGDLGDDQIVGGLGADSLWGGDGVDTFIYTTVTDSSVKTGIDKINDFITGDKIDLRAIDANVTTKLANEAFRFTSAPALNAVWVKSEGGNTVICADNDGKAGADLEIHLIGQVNLTAEDFVL